MGNRSRKVTHARPPLASAAGFYAILLVNSLASGCSDGPRGEVGIYLDGAAGDGGDRSDSDANVDEGEQNGDGDSGACGASVKVVALRKPTTVWLVVDASYAMGDTDDANLGVGVTGWQALRRLLVGEDGLIPAFEEAVKFGIVFHAWSATSCPVQRTVAPVLDNADRIASMYPAEPLTQESGPVTYRGLAEVHDWLASNESEREGQQIVVIAKTPFLELACNQDVPPEGAPIGPAPDELGRMLTRDNLNDLVDLGVTAFVLRIPLRTVLDDAFDRELASIGGTGHPYAPKNAAALRTDFQGILRDSVSCEITLNGRVPTGDECLGTVEVDGVEVPCDAKDGFRLKDPSTLEFVGSACENLRDHPAAKVEANFPCGVILF